LLPDPYGISYDGLPFRTVSIRIPWSDFGIRCDMKSYSRNREDSWVTGQWLATRGKRLGDLDLPKIHLLTPTSREKVANRTRSSIGEVL
jgi:hypothetical protein